MLPAALSQEVAGQVILMQALHDHNNGARVFVVEARDKRAAVPVDDSLPGGLRMELIGVQGIVDDDQIGAASGKRSANGSRISAAALGRDEFESGFFGKPRMVIAAPWYAEVFPELRSADAGSLRREPAPS